LGIPASAVLHNALSLATVETMAPHEATPLTEIGKRIRRRRKAQKMTLRDAAFEVGLNTSVYCRLELGLRQARFDELERIAVALGCSVRDLVPPKAA
jgi:DNA-binding Xre family transcriptional regulator